MTYSITFDGYDYQGTTVYTLGQLLEQRGILERQNYIQNYENNRNLYYQNLRSIFAGYYGGVDSIYAFLNRFQKMHMNAKEELLG